MSKSPFKPTFGVSPPLLVGRDQQLRDFADALEDGPGAPGRATLYVGARGTGKTVMLNEAQHRARERGWLVVSETATDGLVERLAREHLPRLLAEHDTAAARARLSGVTLPAGLGGAQWERSVHEAAAGLRTQVERLCDILAEHETGLLLTVDELHRKPLADLIELFTTIQHVFREERELAFAGAGLPSAVNHLLGEASLTFLRRAEAQHLGKVDAGDVARALRGPIEESGRRIGDDALHIAVDATAGYPFLIQLVGHQVYRQHADAAEISVADARRGAEEARRRMGQLVHGVALGDCSDIDKTFLLAMAQDDGPAAIADVARRMGVSDKYAGVYRARLIAAEMIEPASRGKVDFALPFLREYLREHAVIDHVAPEDG